MAFTPDKRIKAQVIAGEKGYVSGLQEAEKIFLMHDIKTKSRFRDGDEIREGDVVLSLHGSSRKIFSISRSALNLLSRMSGITTLTRKYVNILDKKNYRARIMATRKTTPLLRHFEKKAVVAGGGLPHRMGLYDMILIKHDHLKMFPEGAAEAVRKAKKSKFNSKIEVEADTITEAIVAAKSAADIIMLDNMSPQEVKEVVKKLTKLGFRKKVKIEVSGGININNVSKYAACGVDFISVGELTHSPRSVDLSLKVVS